MSSGATSSASVDPPGAGRPSARLACLLLLLALPACASRGGVANPGVAESSLEWAGLRFRVQLLPSGTDRLEARATVTNISDRFLVREVPFCVAVLRVYRGGRAVWDQAADACIGRRIVRLRVGESETYWTAAGADEILPAGADGGRYTVRAYWPAERRPDAPSRTQMEITVGEVRLEPR